MNDTHAVQKHMQCFTYTEYIYHSNYEYYRFPHTVTENDAQHARPEAERHKQY